MLKPGKRDTYRPSQARLETRRIRVNLIEGRGLNAPVVSMAGPWTAKNWHERNLFLHEAIELRDKLNALLPPDQESLEGEVV